MKSWLLLTFFVISASLCQAQSPTLYGMTSKGGMEAVGNIFQTNSNGSAFQNDFSFYTQTCYPSGNLIKSGNGLLLYGMTYQGGANNLGMMFSYNLLTGIETDLHNFGSATDGRNPNGSLLRVNDSLFYGMTQSGGKNNRGIIFSYNNSSGIETDIHDFGSGTDGAVPQSSLIQVGDSLLYGVTQLGGINNDGVIFSCNISSGNETVLYNFGAGTDGQNPYGSLVQASNGLLYGMTQAGGVYSTGTIFSYNSLSATETNIYNFGKGSDGNTPYGSLIQANDGLLYGMTAAGGAYNVGTIFNYNISSSTENDIYDFGSGTDGVNPYGSLIQASDGLLYGMTAYGGVYNYGMVFSYNISTGTETDINDLVGSNGEYPYGDLLEDDTPSPYGNGSVLIFPNPSSGQFTIRLPDNQFNFSGDVYNLLGEKIYQFVLVNSQNTLNLSALATGIYFIYLKSDQGVTVAKVAVVK